MLGSVSPSRNHTLLKLALTSARWQPQKSRAWLTQLGFFGAFLPKKLSRSDYW